MRRLSREDRELWAALRRTVRPLRPMRVPAEDPPAPAEPEKRAAAAVGPLPGHTPAASPQPHLGGLEERLRRRLSRGLAEVDGRIDLHGMRQERAFAALVVFLRQSQMRGNRLVLVITGKGRDGDAAAGEGRGVLRRTVPGWLTRPDLRDLVSGFEEASRKHGGAGALYVRIRRRPTAGRSG